MLSMTPKELKERTALRINPCKTCQPVGAIYCALGVHIENGEVVKEYQI